MRAYLAGPISGLPEGNRPAFREAAKALRAQGIDVISPVEIDEADGFSAEAAAEPSGGRKWQELLGRDVRIVADADTEAIILLPGWGASRGAALEVHVARELGKAVLSYPDLEPLPERHPSSAAFHAHLRRLADLHDRKQSDYGRADDPFANVRASEDWGMDAWVGAMVRATDKVRRLQTFARTGSLANEGVVDAFDDLAVYAVIARVLYEEASGDSTAQIA